jgi:HEAT repeat protein
MNSNTRRLIASSVSAAVLLVLVAGCNKNRQAYPAMGQAGPHAILETPGFDPKDPIAVSGLRERAITTIEEAANSKDAQIRANAVEAASLAPDRLKKVIDNALDDRNPGVRTVAAMAVGKVRLSKSVPRVRPLVSDQSPYVKSAAIFALARCEAEVDRTPLAGMLLHDPSLRVRSHVAFIFGELGDPSALPLLRQSISEHTGGMRPEQVKLFELQVAEAMVKLGDRAQCGFIQAALHPSHPEELESIALAAQLIGEVQDSSAAAQLVTLADYREVANGDRKHPSGKKMRTYPPEVRLAAAGALSSLGIKGTAAPKIAEEYASSTSAPIRSQAAFVYGRIGGVEHLGTLDAMMGDPESGVRVAAAAAVLRCLSGQGVN